MGAFELYYKLKIVGILLVIVFAIGIFLYPIQIGLLFWNAIDMLSNPVNVLIGIAILVALYLLFKKGNNKNKSSDMFSVKTFISYGVAFSIGYWFSIIIIPFIKTTNLYLIYAIIGICLGLSAGFCEMLLYNTSKIVLDKQFVIWALINSFVVYGLSYLIRKIDISNPYLFYLAVGFGIAIVTYIIERFMYKK